MTYFDQIASKKRDSRADTIKNTCCNIKGRKRGRE